MNANKFLLTANQGNRTALDKAYNNNMNSVLNSFDEEEENRWETYNLVISELMSQGNKNYFKEVKYRLTDGENPNEIILDIIDRANDDASSLVWLLKRRIEEYVEDDYFKRFLV